MAIVQVKAEPFEPAKIEPEMAPKPKGVIRPSIASLAKDRGLYVIASTRDDPADPRRADRVAAMGKVLDDHGLAGKIKVEFLGARQIADWVEEFPPLAIWVREHIGKPIQGWNGYGPWAYKETDQEAEFIVGEEPRVFGPGATDGMTDLQAIEAIRRDLAAGGTVRLVGLSGVGKTRLAQALFDPRIKTDTPALSQDWAIYTDISNSPDPSPEAMIEALGGSSAPSILIVDNCGQKSHSALVERKAKAAKTIGLLTIEYDIQDDLPEDTVFYRLEGASDETMSVLLRARYQHLSLNDVHTVIAASDGNSRLAFALASTSKYTDDLSSLKDGELFRRLFEQSQGAGDELLRCAKAASLIYSFDGEAVSPNSEMAILAAFAGTTVANFHRNMVDLKRRGLLQERGKWRALLPHAVSNRLAAQALEEQLASEIEERLFTHAPERVRSSFAHRLSFLHTSPAAIAIVSGVMDGGSSFSDISRLTAKDLPIFLRLAAVAPERALAAAERFAAGGDLGKLHEFEIEKIAQLVQSIAYDANLFDRCVEVLLTLLPLQPTVRNTREKKLEQLRALFQPYYSGTLATGVQRAPHIERLLASSVPEDVDIAIALLEEALKVRGFRPPAISNFGARKRSVGWWPQDIQDYRAWYLLFIGIAEEHAFRNDAIGHQVRAILGRGVFGYIQDPAIADHIHTLAPRLIACDDWLPALKSINSLLRQKDLKPDLREKATAFKKLLAPTTLRAKVHAVISMRAAIDDDEECGDISAVGERAAAKAESIGRELAKDTALLREMTPTLLGDGAHNFTISLGRGVAMATSDPSVLMEDIRAHALASTKPANLNPTFIFGLISGWGERNPGAADALLDSALDDEALGSWLPTLQMAVPLTHDGAHRIRRALAVGRAPLWRYRELGYGGRLKPISVDEIGQILNDIASKGLDGVHVALDILHMVTFSANERDVTEQIALGRYCQGLLTRADWPRLDHGQEHLDYEIEELIKFATKQSEDFQAIQPVLARAVEARTLHPRYLPSTTGNFLAPIIRRYPQDALTYLLNLEDLQRRHAMSDLILEESSNSNDGCTVSAVSDDLLAAWCKEDPASRALFAARICQLTEATDNSPSISRRLYDIAPDKSAFLLEFAERALTAGSSEEQLPILRQVLALVSSFPAVTGAPEHQTREQTIQWINERIDMWDRVIGQSMRERDQSFE
ncbi:MAG: hypothetical protein J0M19_00035 [Sphingomonadales bacterium]|nr:hypothetical protein [Sphingomonadales bacterium]